MGNPNENRFFVSKPKLHKHNTVQRQEKNSAHTHTRSHTLTLETARIKETQQLHGWERHHVCVCLLRERDGK